MRYTTGKQLSQSKCILLTGAAGYIGSHTWIELIESGYEVIGVDNFCNSSERVLERIQKIINQDICFYKGDVQDFNFMRGIFERHQITGAIHFAALKAVGDSVKDPLAYYSNNLESLISLLRAMQEFEVRDFVFSSSATVYGDPEIVPIQETANLQPTNPYGQTKLIGEQILRDLEKSDDNSRVVYLRYFNPIGAHISGLIGEDPRGRPNNLSPVLAQVAAGRLDKVMVFGNDWPTSDGTGVRDYIHVVDLARAHVKAIDYLIRGGSSITLNLGTGIGYSVFDLISAYERVSGLKIPVEITSRRAGDIATCYADPQLAEKILGWVAEYELDRMCADSWRWQSMNPNGFN
jgi:UDP-glucose 4-epimerase